MNHQLENYQKIKLDIGGLVLLLTCAEWQSAKLQVIIYEFSN